MGALTMLNIVPAVFNIVTGVVVYGFAKIWYPATTEGVTAVAHGATRGMWLAFINHYGIGNALFDLVEAFFATRYCEIFLYLVVVSQTRLHYYKDEGIVWAWIYAGHSWITYPAELLTRLTKPHIFRQCTDNARQGEEQAPRRPQTRAMTQDLFRNVF